MSQHSTDKSQQTEKLQQLEAEYRKRIEAINYGECTRCGEPVEPARLEAMPQAENCVRCANAA